MQGLEEANTKRYSKAEVTWWQKRMRGEAHVGRRRRRSACGMRNMHRKGHAAKAVKGVQAVNAGRMRRMQRKGHTVRDANGAQGAVCWTKNHHISRKTMGNLQHGQ